MNPSTKRILIIFAVIFIVPNVLGLLLAILMLGGESLVMGAGSVIIGLAVAYPVTANMKKQLKSVSERNSARFYMEQSGLSITTSKDLYLGSHVTRHTVSSNNHHGGGGGHRGGGPRGGGHRGGGGRGRR